MCLAPFSCSYCEDKGSAILRELSAKLTEGFNVAILTDKKQLHKHDGYGTI